MGGFPLAGTAETGDHGSNGSVRIFTDSRRGTTEDTDLSGFSRIYSVVSLMAGWTRSLPQRRGGVSTKGTRSGHRMVTRRRGTVVMFDGRISSCGGEKH